MSRKRKSDDSTPIETQTETTLPPVTETGTAVAEPPAEPQPTTFAERVGQKQPAAPDPFGIARDNLAGVRLLESRQDRVVAIKFGDGSPESKPSQAVIDKVKSAGFRWNQRDRVWTRPVWGDNAMSTRIEAEQLYQEVRQMIREEKGIEGDGQGVPF